MSSQTVVLKVGMSCQGCVGAVKRVLSKMEGVESYDINIEEQKVTVNGNVKPDDVFQTVSKTGKKTSFWEEAAAPTNAAETKTADAAETKTSDAAETKPADAETKPVEDETPAAETESKPADTETKPQEAVAAPAP